MAPSTPHDSQKLLINRIRPSASAIQSSSATAASPHTPLSRSVSSLYGSPSGSFRAEDENVLVFELGARYFRAGFAGEGGPRCELAYHPDHHRRAGDYRQFAFDIETSSRKRKRGRPWGEEYELWRPDARDESLSLIGDRIERMVRDVENKYLMLDNRTRKVALVVSPLLSHPLLEVALASLFNVLQCPSITVLPSSVMAAVGGGLRSALVIDIGWAETSVSAVLEYREVAQKRTVRASKMLNEEFSKAIAKGEDITFTEGEEVLTRMAWCREREGSGVTKIGGNEAALSISFSATSVQLTTNDLAAPADRVLFAQNTPNQELDDHELPIHLLAYNVLLSLPIDVRKLCMSRIVIAGGASNMPGLKRRVLQELEYLVQQRGWDPVRNYGSAGMRRKGDVLPKRAVNVQSSAVPGTIPVKGTEDTASPPPAAVDFAPAHLSPQEPDPVFAKLRQQQLKLDPIPVEGVVRAVNTLGAWAGASLAMNLRVRGVVEIERERFMQHGLVGGASKKEVSVAAQRQSLGPGVRPGGTERSSWNLGIWA